MCVRVCERVRVCGGAVCVCVCVCVGAPMGQWWMGWRAEQGNCHTTRETLKPVGSYCERDS